MSWYINLVPHCWCLTAEYHYPLTFVGLVFAGKIVAVCVDKLYNLDWDEWLSDFILLYWHVSENYMPPVPQMSSSSMSVTNPLF